ncbi:MAG TPA: S9 family peptidase [Candidatus Limnocylindrales bacterium]|nr:S9 family peptidase [Candidatus Limnocylindrales bacterium]
MTRSFRPDDLYRFRIATDPRLSPDGSLAVFTVQTVAPAKDGYRHALWAVATDGDGSPRQLTIGVRHDRHGRFAPDGRSLAFLSDRRLHVEEEPAAGDAKQREDGQQVHLLPLDGGEARRLTDLPRGVDAFWWSPDGRQLLVTSSSRGATRDEDRRRRGKAGQPKPGEAPESDYHFLDRLGYQANGAGLTHHVIDQLWIVEVATGDARRLNDEPAGVGDAAWSPDGRRIVYTTNLRRDYDLEPRSHLVVVDADGGGRVRLTGDAATFAAPVWMPDGASIAAIGGYLPENVYGSDLWLIAADGSEATTRHGGRNLTGDHDVMLATTIGSDIVPSEGHRAIPSADGHWLTFRAPIDGSVEIWRVATRDGSLERLTTGHHAIGAFDQVDLGGAGSAVRTAWLCSSPTALNDLWLRDGATDAPRRSTDLNHAALAEIELREQVERWSIVDGRRIQGWFLAGVEGAGSSVGVVGPGGTLGRVGPGPLVTEIHGGPHTLYGWAPILEFQILAATGMSVFFCNPRGSEGYGRDFNEANIRDWGPGPMRDVLAGVDALVAEGLANPARLGVTGGSYGGYLTNWIVGHDDRFAAAMTCRSVSDMALLMLTGDISTGFWPFHEFRTTPWDDPAYFREISPITYADRIRTPLLIQHSENDIRTTVGQAEALFTVLRSKKRPVRLLRVPEETHELTRSGAPFRRVENLAVVRDWFRHFLVDGKRRLPPLPKIHGGR